MATQYHFRGQPDTPDCFAPPPPIDCMPECQPCDNPCEPKCPPKVRAHEALCLVDNEWERCFSLFQMVGCEPTKVPAFFHCIELRIRRQGFCKVLTKECPIRTDNKGNACFVWTDKFREMPAGYYEGDLYIDDKHCFTLLFRKQCCWAKMQSESAEHEPTACQPPEGCCNGCVPTPDFETVMPNGDCEKCYGSECE